MNTMYPKVSHRFIALALVLFMSQTLLFIHAIKHIDKDNVQCPLCITQAQQSHGLPVLSYHFHSVQGQTPAPDVLLPSIPDQNHTYPYFQRAPPVSA